LLTFCLNSNKLNYSIHPVLKRNPS
jgi:hypothetical protein